MSCGIVFPPLRNGVDYLQDAVRRLGATPSPTDLRYAVLHLHVGVEVLLKYRLICKDWRPILDDTAEDAPEVTEQDYEAGKFRSIRHDTPGRAYYRRKLADGKTSMEAMRCLKRRLSDVVYQRMVRDAHCVAVGSEDTWGVTTNSSAADLNPVAGTSEKSFPQPANSEDRAAASSSA